MARLIDEIDELAGIERAMADNGRRNHAERRANLVALRRRFAMQLTRIVEAIESDARLAADADLAGEFRTRFSRMRAVIAEHQARFPAVMLDSVDQDYHESGVKLVESNRAFIDWARGALK